jgi:hypothetical protein
MIVLVLWPFFKYPWNMREFSDFEQLLSFDKEVLEQIVREGELMLEAQLVTANAGDQRALTFMGYLVATATAAVGAAIALLLSEPPRIDRIPFCVLLVNFCIQSAKMCDSQEV